MKLKLFIISFLVAMLTYSQNWKNYQVNEKGKIVGSMVIGNLNDTIYASGNNGSSLFNSFIYSKDKGSTWSEPKGILTNDYGSIAQYVGVKDRVYASLKLPTSDYLYYYSKDNGNSWVLDTIGLPHFYGIKSRQKDAFILKKLGNDYIVAYNSLTVNAAYYKKIDDNSWKPLVTSSSKVNYGIVSVNNTWVSLNPSYLASSNEYITKSTDNGTTWQPIETTGLPNTMYGSILASNGTGRLFLGASISSITNKTAVFYSDDNGKTWQNTNAETLVPFENNRYIVDIFAVDNKVIITYNTGFNSPVLYLFSDTENPNFVLGDTSGLVNNTFAFANVSFSIDDSIYINHYNDLYSMDNQSLNTESFRNNISVVLSPNPVQHQLKVKSTEDFYWNLFSILGETVKSGKYKNNSDLLIDFSNLSKGIYIFSTNSGYSKKIIKK
ncbi:T9SS type A sorting domain-containing protein [Polaribacter marinivivus]|uniref:T9SS type A sorting domain-containing protein n=1 Tax=Polaribacter marinivivus TaxID=1524260 RepID=A0ABV8RD64_9FLAO